MDRWFDDVILYGFLIIGIAAVVMAVDLILQLNDIDLIKVFS